MSSWCIFLSACGGRDERAAFTASTPPASLPTRFYAPEGWTWGLLRVGDQPPVRYGVGAPRRAHRGEIVIVPGFGEPAEAWFETANALIDREWGVWILDLHGQGGSARASLPRDMALVDSFEPDAEALNALVSQVIRPTGDRPVVVLASGIGGAVALDALSLSPSGVSGAVLSAPIVAFHPRRLPADQGEIGETARWMRRVGFGDGFASGQDSWSSTAVTGPPGSHDPLRERVATEWMRANPDLRTGGASWSWMAAWVDLSERVRDPTLLRRISTPIEVIAPSEDAWSAPDSAAEACRALPRCTLTPLPGSRSQPHLETDPIRRRWLDTVLAFAEARG